MNYCLDPAGGLSIHWGGRKVAWNPFPLEMEKAGKVHYGVLSRKSRTTLFGCLADDQGIFLTCEISFRPRRFGKTPFLEEKRVYRAVRDIPKALLTVRQYLEPALKEEDGFLVIPALWYGDNEAWNEKIPYPKGLEKDWSFKADGSSCPSVVWTGKDSSYALAFGDSVRFPGGRPGLDDVLGVGFAGFPSGPQALVTFPAQQIPQSYPFGRKLKKPAAPRLDWKKGRTLTLTLRHFTGVPSRDFHTKVWRAHMEGASKPFRYKPSEPRLLRTAELFTHCLKESHYREGKGFSHRHDLTEIFSGWCGGFAAADAALRWADRTGDPLFRRMGETMCEYLCREGLSPSGFFYSENSLGVWLEKVFWAKADGLNLRNPSEGCCYLSLILERERTEGRYRAEWGLALRSNLEAVLKLQRPDGAFPHEVDSKTGKAVSWVGASSGAWVGALAVHSRIDEDQARGRRYLAAAKRAAAYYRKNYVEKERYIGGPYDTYMAPNMEDPYNLLLAYCELFRTTKERKWLAAAKRVADHLLSWRYVYDVRFPDGTVCRKHKVKTFHMSPASVANKHIQNWDTLADAYLLELAEWLKAPFYADCARQHLEASTQLVQEGQLPKGIPYGGQSEQWYASDFNWFGNCGKYSKGNLWQITVALPKAGFLISLDALLKRKRRDN